MLTNAVSLVKSCIISLSSRALLSRALPCAVIDLIESTANIVNLAINLPITPATKTKPGPPKKSPSPFKIPLPIFVPNPSASPGVTALNMVLKIFIIFLAGFSKVSLPILADICTKLAMVSFIIAFKVSFNSLFFTIASFVALVEIFVALAARPLAFAKSFITAFKTLIWKTPPINSDTCAFSASFKLSNSPAKFLSICIAGSMF